MAKGAVDGTPLRVTRDAVIRFLLGAQHLAHGGARGSETAATPAAVLREIRHLECVQIDPVSVVERNQHLVLAARLPGYLPGTLGELLRRRRVFEYWANAACVVPIEDYPIFEGTRRRYRTRLAPDLTALRHVVRRILADIDARGPLTARAFVSDHRVRGAWDLGDPKTKATSHALSLLLKTGDLLVVKREGLERYFDLPERAVPSALPRARAISAHDADELMLEKYLRAYRLFDAGDPRFGWRAMTAAGRHHILQRHTRAGGVVPLLIDGVGRQYFVRAGDVDNLRRGQRPAGAQTVRGDDPPMRFLAPLDNLLWRRSRLQDLFRFEYTWEVYLPPRKRRYGHYAMPILFGDRLIGRLDPHLDREDRRLVIRLLHLEPQVRPTGRLRRALRAALESFARFHGAAGLDIGRTVPAGLRL
jgi:uncharacterized protein YcaQ